MKQPFLLPIPLRLAAVMVCASFLATYAAAEDTTPAASTTPTQSASICVSDDNSEVQLPLVTLPDGQTMSNYEVQVVEAVQEQAIQKLYQKRAKRWQLVLVNGDNLLSDKFQPKLTDIGDGKQFDKRAAKSLLRMIADGQKAGHDLYICSAYRDDSYQTRLFARQVEKQRAAGKSRKQARRAAARVVAQPGTSEHATGLAADIVNTQYSEKYSSLTRGFENTKAFHWLKKHCTDYGFVLRYPEDKTEITGVIYEPWHFRYVGITAAHTMQQEGLCLEEYLGKVSS